MGYAVFRPLFCFDNRVVVNFRVTGIFERPRFFGTECQEYFSVRLQYPLDFINNPDDSGAVRMKDYMVRKYAVKGVILVRESQDVTGVNLDFAAFALTVAATAIIKLFSCFP